MKKILLFLAEGFETLEASAFIDVMGWNLVDGDHSTELFSCGFKKGVKSSFHQTMIVDYLIKEVNVNEFDALAIPGGFEEYNFYHEAYDDQFLNLIREFKKYDKIIASICVGALPIGRSGILEGKRATTYNKNANRIKMLQDFGAHVINEPVVMDDNIITSWNPSTSVDVALLLLAMLTSKSNADHIKDIMGFTNITRS